MNGYSESRPSECRENGNVTVVSIDHDPGLNESKTNTVVEDSSAGVQEGAAQVIDASNESDMFVVQEESPKFCCVETIVEEHSTCSSVSSMSDDVGSSVAFTEAVVQDSSEEWLSCAAELVQEDMQVCELVECTESVHEDFQVAMVDGDDSVSVYSLGSTENVKAQMHEITMECVENNVEEVPMNPVEKALIRRG